MSKVLYIHCSSHPTCLVTEPQEKNPLSCFAFLREHSATELKKPSLICSQTENIAFVFEFFFLGLRHLEGNLPGVTCRCSSSPILLSISCIVASQVLAPPIDALCVSVPFQTFRRSMNQSFVEEDKTPPYCPRL